MKVRVTMEVAGRKIDEALTGPDADSILAQAKARVATELGWKGLFLNAMTPLGFAQKAVTLYNSAHQTKYGLPQSAEEFLHLGQDLGYINPSPRLASEHTMVDYDDLPLFPLHVVLFPDMPLPLHIFEPRYREMVMRCREEKSPFGVILIRDGEEEADTQAVPHLVGTTARITQYEEMPDGRMNILVFGETRFRITHTSHDKPYLSARVEPLVEEADDAHLSQPAAEAVTGLFKKYLRALFAMTGRSLSALQLPHEPAYLSYAVASVLQVPLAEKQSLLEIASTTRRLEHEAELLRAEIETQNALQAVLGERTEADGRISPVDTQELGKLASLN